MTLDPKQQAACTHDLAEMETACADGMCPLCLSAALSAAPAAEDVRELAEWLTNMAREKPHDARWKEWGDALTRLSASEAAVRSERDHLAAMVRAIGKRYPEVCDMARAEVVRNSASKAGGKGGE